MRIIAFGDSITYGAWDSSGGWVERLKSQAHAATLTSKGETRNQVMNLGIGGNTSRGLLERIESETVARMSPKWSPIFIISIGTNDGRTRDGEQEVPIENYEQNLNEIITIVQRYGNDIIILGLPPLGVEILDFGGQIYSDVIIKEYDAVLERVALEHGLTYAPTRPAFESAEPGALFAYDQLHPAAAGHELIAKIVTSYLEDLGVVFE